MLKINKFKEILYIRAISLFEQFHKSEPNHNSEPFYIKEPFLYNEPIYIKELFHIKESFYIKELFYIFYLFQMSRNIILYIYFTHKIFINEKKNLELKNKGVRTLVIHFLYNCQNHKLI